MMSDNINFISTGSADVHTKYLDIRQISNLYSEEISIPADYVIQTLMQIQYGIPQERIVAMKTSSQVLAGHNFISVTHTLVTNFSICYDSWNGRFLNHTSGKYCVPVKMLISPIESAKLRDAVSRLCPDKPEEIREAIFTNLINCNKALSLFRHPVCYIDCDDKLIPLFSSLFKNS